MNKSDLVAAVAAKANVSRKTSEDAVKAVIDSVTEALADGEKVSLPGFGTFAVRERAARACKNPRTGEKIEIEASKVPTFKAGSAFKEAINN